MLIWVCVGQGFGLGVEWLESIAFGFFFFPFLVLLGVSSMALS